MSDYIIEITESKISAEEAELTLYGLRITVIGGDEMHFPALSPSIGAVSATAEKLKSGSVSPAHISDIIEDDFFFPSL